MEIPEQADLETLKQIQERHIYSIPVENLDIIEGRLPLSLEVGDLYDKVVNRRRGGISFELNLLLADMLKSLGYTVKPMSARHPRYGSEFDHAFLMVAIPGDDSEWIVDVGYTECFRTPLLFDCRIWQSDGRDEYRFEPSGTDAWKLMRRRGGEMSLVYSFSLAERQLDEYAEQCAWFCNDEASRFTQGPFVFVERPEGRICLSIDTVSNTFTGEQIRPIVKDKDEQAAVLREIFGIEVDGAASDDLAEGKFGHKRVFAAIGNDGLFDRVIEKAVEIALEEKAHLRFGHIAQEPSSPAEGGFPAHVALARKEMSARVERKLTEMGAIDEVLGGEVVVMGLNTRIGATIDTPVGYAPEQLVESLVKPFDPDVVVCGSGGKSRLQAFFKGSASDYLSRKLTCEVVKVS